MGKPEMEKETSVINIDDFSESDFADPITLLDALKQRKESPVRSALIKSSIPAKKGYLTISQVTEKYGLPVSEVISAFVRKDLDAAVIIPLFTKESIDEYSQKRACGDPTLYNSFLREINHMRVNYSYKPILLLAIMDSSNANGEISMSETIDYYFDYYNQQGNKRGEYEKPNSTFVTKPLNRTTAKRTIITYPIRVLMAKGFIDYDKTSEMIKLVPGIWKCMDNAAKDYVRQKCNEILENYYADI